MGVGVLHGKSSKQKLKVKRSTEAELVGVNEYLPYNIWLLNFMSAKGYEIRDNVLCQDNQSTIIMLKNGRNSCTGNSRLYQTYLYVHRQLYIWSVLCMLYQEYPSVHHQLYNIGLYCVYSYT